LIFLNLFYTLIVETLSSTDRTRKARQRSISKDSMHKNNNFNSKHFYSIERSGTDRSDIGNENRHGRSSQNGTKSSFV
jgi:hypothetical protein